LEKAGSLTIANKYTIALNVQIPKLLLGVVVAFDQPFISMSFISSWISKLDLLLSESDRVHYEDDAKDLRQRLLKSIQETMVKNGEKRA
jgi:hypothetical protein